MRISGWSSDVFSSDLFCGHQIHWSNDSRLAFGMCQPVVSANRSLHKRRLPVVGPRPNNSFNPNPLRYTNSMADQACHAVGSTTQVGLTQALGLMTDIHPLFFVALIVLLGWLGLTGLKTLARSRSLSDRRLFFVVGVVLFLALVGGVSWTFVWA